MDPKIHQWSENMRKLRGGPTSGVCGGVSSFMVTVDSNVETKVLRQVLVSTEAQHVSVVAYMPQLSAEASTIPIEWRLTDQIQILVDGKDRFSGVVEIPVNPSSQCGESGKKVDGILQSIGPVFGLLDARFICGLELAIVIESCHTHAKLGHGV